MDGVRLLAWGIAIVSVVGCGETRRIVDADAARDTGAADAATDAAPDASPGDTGAPDTGPGLEGIDAVLMSPDGPVDVAIIDMLVTYLRPAMGEDHAGFFIQSEVTGPALFVQMEPPAGLSVGDRVSFRVTDVVTQISHKRATGIADLTTSSSGNDVAFLIQDVSSTADLVANLDDYAHELIRVDLTISALPEPGGAEFNRAAAETVGVTGDARLHLRLPAPLWASYPLAQWCTLHVEGTPFWAYNENGQISAWDAAEISDVVCP